MGLMVRIHRVHSRSEHPFDDQLPEDFLRSKDKPERANETSAGSAAGRARQARCQSFERNLHYARPEALQDRHQGLSRGAEAQASARHPYQMKRSRLYGI